MAKINPERSQLERKYAKLLTLKVNILYHKKITSEY